MILKYGNKYIYNKEYTKEKEIKDDKKMLNKTIKYLSKMEELLIKKNMPIPNDWYKNIHYEIISR